MAVLLNKADLLGEEQLAELAQWYKENCRAEQVSVALGLDSPRSVAPHNK
jgi:G3E family GTPase